jgi:hypothetical protein
MTLAYLHRASALDPRDPERDRYEEALRLIELEAIEQIYTERMQSLEWISDASGDMTTEEWDAVCAAIRDNDALSVGQLLIAGVQRVIRAYAGKHAPQRMKEILRELEDEAAIAQMESPADYSRIGEGWA